MPDEEYRLDGDAEDSRRLELHVRALSPNGARSRQERVVARLEQLDTDGTIDAFTINVWGARFCPESAASRTDSGQFIAERIETFEEWARRVGVSLGPLFETRKVRSLITEDTRSVVVLPTMLLAEFGDGGLRHVAPHVKDEGFHTIDERLETIDRADAMAVDGDISRESGTAVVPSVAGSGQEWS